MLEVWRTLFSIHIVNTNKHRRKVVNLITVNGDYEYIF